MRKDMSKVLTERPRGGGHKPKGLTRRHRYGKSPIKQEGIRKPYKAHWSSKHFTDHLAPVARWLEKQIGRPWNKVWSDLKKALPKGGELSHHLAGHVKDMVQEEVYEENKKIFYSNHMTWKHSSSVELHNDVLYVCPRTGLLKKYQDRHTNQFLVKFQDRIFGVEYKKDFRKELEDGNLLYFIHGAWFLLKMKMIPRGRWVGTLATPNPSINDIIIGKVRLLTSISFRGLHLYYSSPDLLLPNKYCYEKKQLSKKEIAKYKLPKATEMY